jgi:WS/DGAT/MGAT family acyltransferase
VGLVKMTECLIERGPEDDNLPPLLDDEPLPEQEPSAWDRVSDALSHRVRARTEEWRRLGSALFENAGETLRSPVSSARQLRDTLASVGRVLAPASEPMSPVMRGRSSAVHFDYLSVPLAELKQAGKKHGGSVNDAFVAGVGGGLARYHAAHGAPVEELRMLMPVNVRGGEKTDQAGNQFAPARFQVPVGIESPAERVRAITRLSREQRDEPALPWIEQISSVLGNLPAPAVTALFGAMQKTTDFTTSNVAGARRPTWMSGALVESVMPFGPLAGAAANITVFSYNGTMHMGINTDPAAVADPELFFECMQKGFDEVLAV